MRFYLLHLLYLPYHSSAHPPIISLSCPSKLGKVPLSLSFRRLYHLRQVDLAASIQISKCIMCHVTALISFLFAPVSESRTTLRCSDLTVVVLVSGISISTPNKSPHLSAGASQRACALLRLPRTIMCPQVRAKKFSYDLTLSGTA